MTETTTAAAETQNSDAVIIHEQIDKASGLAENVIQHIKDAVPSIVFAFLILLIGFLFVKIISLIISKALKRPNVDEAARGFLTSLIRIILYIVVIIMALSAVKVPMSSIITIFGAAGLAISLALQNCLSNLCGGFIILFSKPFTAGDMIEIDNSVGVVKSISILYTKIVTLDNKTIFIPNGKVSDAKIINYTADPNRRVDLSFSIAYTADYELAVSVIKEAVKNEKLILDDPKPTIRMNGHNESSVGIDVLLWVHNEDYFAARYNILEAVKAAFDENNIEIPFNQLDVHMKE